MDHFVEVGKSEYGNILRGGSNYVLGDSCGDVKSTCSVVAHSSDVAGNVGGVTPREDVNQILREELGNANITSNPVRSGVSNDQDLPLCISVMFDVGGRSRVFGGKELSWGEVTDASEGLPESLITSGGFLASKDFALQQADARLEALYGNVEGYGMVQVPPADELFGQEGKTGKKLRFYLSESAKRFVCLRTTLK